MLAYAVVGESAISERPKSAGRRSPPTFRQGQGLRHGRKNIPRNRRKLAVPRRKSAWFREFASMAVIKEKGRHEAPFPWSIAGLDQAAIAALLLRR
jgi:hypothetical protein